VTTLTAMPAAPARSGRAGAGAGAPRGIAREPRPFFDGAGGGPTLDDVVSGAWEELTAHAVVECLVCGGGLAPEYGAHARPIGGRCRNCGTTLS
jgi:hypothetical protein